MKNVKKLMATLLTASVVVGSLTGSASVVMAEDTKELAVMVPSADHGWSGALLNYAQEQAEELNNDAAFTEKFSAKVYAATGVENQIQQVDDLLANTGKLAGIVILPYDNGLQSTLEKIAAADVPFVQFDRIINSDVLDAKVVSNVKGDNEGMGYETARRFIADGMTKDDYVYELIGDNSSVPELRSKGFRDFLRDEGWTEEEIEAVVVKSAATNWSRDTGRELFESWFGSSQCDTAKNNWIYTHDDGIALGILDALNGSALDAAKKDEFMKCFKGLSAPGGLAENYAVMKGTHQVLTKPETFDMFCATYDPAMICDAVNVMISFLNGETVEKDIVIPVDVVDETNVTEFQPFGTYEEKK